VVMDILSLPKLPFPSLQGFAQTPVFLPGSILLDQEGYHPETGLHLHLGNLAGVCAEMSLEKARALLLGELLGDFPFVDPVSRAHALALLLQPLIRLLIAGPTPLYLIEAPARGTGKGLLAEMVASVTLGLPGYVMALPRNEGEVEKRITAALLQGHPLVLLDNVTRLDSAILSAVLTTTRWHGRRLGRSEIVEAPNMATWMATGNNVDLSDEMVRRLVPVRLDAGVERPEERTGFQHPDLLAWVRTNRPLLLSACLSLVQVWVNAGMPPAGGTLGRFEGWVKVIAAFWKWLVFLAFSPTETASTPRRTPNLKSGLACVGRGGRPSAAIRLLPEMYSRWPERPTCFLRCGAAVVNWRPSKGSVMPCGCVETGFSGATASCGLGSAVRPAAPPTGWSLLPKPQKPRNPCSQVCGGAFQHLGFGVH
jgi:hypothetical protein